MVGGVAGREGFFGTLQSGGESFSCGDGTPTLDPPFLAVGTNTSFTLPQKPLSRLLVLAFLIEFAILDTAWTFFCGYNILAGDQSDSGYLLAHIITEATRQKIKNSTQRLTNTLDLS